MACRTTRLVSSFTYGFFHVHSRFVGFSTPPAVDRSQDHGDDGDGTKDGSVSQDWNYDTNGTLTWYKPHLFLGDHQFKMGFDYIAGSDVSGSAGSPYNYIETVFNGGVPFELFTFNWPVRGLRHRSLPGHLRAGQLDDRDRGSR